MKTNAHVSHEKAPTWSVDPPNSSMSRSHSYPFIHLVFSKSFYSKGLVRVPHQTRKVARPTVSTTLARTETPTVSSGRRSWKIWDRY